MVALFMVFAVATLVAALVLTYLVFFEDGAKSTGRWGVRREKKAAGTSPYRTGECTEEFQQGAPLWLRFVSWLCAMGGVATAAVLAPAGLILVMLLVDRGALACVPLFLVSVSGFPAGALLVSVARRVTRSEAVKPTTFRYLYAHHVCVAATMLLVDANAGGDFHLSPISVVTCLVVLAPMTLVHWVSKVPREDDASPPPPVTTSFAPPPPGPSSPRAV